MANVLHRAHFSADAAILAHAALDLTTDLLTSHYTLGNIYAVSEDTSSQSYANVQYLIQFSANDLHCSFLPVSLVDVGGV